jgi:hypothetical protein
MQFIPAFSLYVYKKDVYPFFHCLSLFPCSAIVVRTEKNFRFMSIRYSAARHIAVRAKHQPRRMDMRFISIMTLNPTSP